MSVPINQEHKEAEQAATNKEREAFIKTLSKKEQAQFKAVTKAVEILKKEGVLFYMFPFLPSLQYRGKMQVWQWNTLGAKMEYDKSGKPKPDTLKENGLYHESFFAFLFGQFAAFFEGATWQEKLDSVPHFFYYCMRKHKEYLESNEN